MTPSPHHRRPSHHACRKGEGTAVTNAAIQEAVVIGDNMQGLEDGEGRADVFMLQRALARCRPIHVLSACLSLPRTHFPQDLSSSSLFLPVSVSPPITTTTLTYILMLACASGLRIPRFFAYVDPRNLSTVLPLPPGVSYRSHDPSSSPPPERSVCASVFPERPKQKTPPVPPAVCSRAKIRQVAVQWCSQFEIS